MSMPNIAVFPDILQPKMALFRKHFVAFEHPLYSAVQQLLLTSDYACRQIELLAALLQEDTCQLPLTKDDYQQLVAQIALDLPSSHFAKALRQFRHRHLLRLLLREFANLASTEDTMAAWSDCADALILHTLNYCQNTLTERYGKPVDEAGNTATLYVLAMGKLGGRELNFSSDVDLIFAYSAAGYTQSEQSISNQEYYSKAIQQFMHLLQNVTVEGFVLRVDLRLRPNGNSAPLVCTLSSMETYYQEQGRDWERYAMVKARLIGESIDSPSHWFHRLITPFVYRRYIDFSVIESLRSMKSMIEREVKLNPMLDDIKRGRGGIREVEFIIQSFQLIRGGRLIALQQQNAMTALAALKHEQLLSRADVLKQAYLFLRRLENALQAQNDQQIHALPLDALKQAQIAFAMDYMSWDEVLSKLQQYQRIVSLAFNAVLSKVDVYEDQRRVLSNQLNNLWQGHVEERMAVNLLASLDFKQPERCYQMIHAFRHAPRCRRLTQAARMRLDRFMVLLLTELTGIAKTDAILLHVIHLLENIVGRSAYLALLTENSNALKELLYWFANSPFITSLLVSHPFLLEVLIDQEQDWKPLTKKELKQVLQSRLIHCEEYEQQEETLRQFKLTCWLLVARAELYKQSHAVRIGKFLADVAEVIIKEALTCACQQLGERYPKINQVASRFAIVAYGKLGSREMNYNSDLDLVFLHAATPSEEGLITRLTQKILHMLTTRSQTGILYSVDTRLRPSGAAGLLVSPIEAFIGYQCTQAWTWEHQALLRARIISANKYIKQKFNQLKKEVLFLPRDKQVLRDDVLNMRAKINKYRDADIKHVEGGLVDLEFLVQFLVLAYPSAALSRRTHTLSLLQKLHDENILDKSQLKALKQAYKYFHYRLHREILQPNLVIENTGKVDVTTISQFFYHEKLIEV